MPDALSERFAEVFRTVFPEFSGEVVPALTASDVPGWDSIAHGNLIMELEEAFDTEINARAAFGCETLGDLAALFGQGGKTSP